MHVQLLPARPLRRAHRRERLTLADGRQTTIHFAEFDLDRTVARVVTLPPRVALARWCRETETSDAIVGGFFTRPGNVPLGELWVDGVRHPSVPFDGPWGPFRSCLSIQPGEVRIAPRALLAAEPTGSLLQAGPMLVDRGRPLELLADDPEGFSSGSRQFDSDVTIGRYPRSALGIGDNTVIAAVCDGRAADDAGLTLSELAGAMADAGAETALNLDGGGSASLVLDGRLANRPREDHGIVIGGGRPVATAIAFELDALR